MISLFGAPGSGKTVQGRLLSQKYGWDWYSSRAILNSMDDKDIKLMLDHGMPIPNEKNIEIIRKVTKYLDYKNNWSVILDELPTSVSQIYWMAEQNYLKHLDGAIILRVPRGELWKRMLERGRADDTRAAIERRQDIYDRSITGIMHVLKANNIRVEEVDGCNSEQDVLERIEEKLDNWRIITKNKFENQENNKFNIRFAHPIFKRTIKIANTDPAKIILPTQQ